MIYRLRRWSAALLLGMLLSLLSILQCFAAGTVSQVNLHIGQTPDAVYLTYTLSLHDALPIWTQHRKRFP